MITDNIVIQNHIAHCPKGIVLERIQRLFPGGKMGDLPPRLQHKSFLRTGEKKTGGPNLRLLRLEMDKPALTVTAYIFNKFVHPTQDRYITPREAACLQDFPDDYVFCGTLGEIHKQVGNAVPVNLAQAIAEHISQYLEQQGVYGELPIASYFAGAGGFDLGFEKANTNHIKFTTRFVTDIEHAPCLTLKHNRPAWNVVEEDIRKLDASEVKRIVGDNPEIIIGGPPCQPFSVAGKQKGTTDPLGQLYRDFIKHINQLKPRIVVMENVYGLAQVKASHALTEICNSFEDIGYHVEYHQLMAADYGTPQLRRRLIFFAIRGDVFTGSLGLPASTHVPAPNLFGFPVYRGAGQSFSHLPTPGFRK